MEALTRALVSLYEEPEQPSDPLNYIRKSIGAGEGVDVDALVRRNQELKEEVEAELKGYTILDGVLFNIPSYERIAKRKG